MRSVRPARRWRLFIGLLPWLLASGGCEGQYPPIKITTPDAQLGATFEPLLIEIDYFAVWRIADPELYFKSIRTRDAALRRLDTVTYSAVQQTLARYTLANLLSEEREEITSTIRDISAEGLAPDGIEVLDLRIRRTVYPEANLPQIYNRMRTERNRFAMRFRAEGEEQSRAIRSATSPR